MAERSIVDIGKFLQSKGLRIGEHPAFGGVGGGHAQGSFHYEPGGAAIDVTDWRPDVAPAFAGGKPIPWKQRTGELSWRAKQLGLFKEALGPGDKGHDTHVHLALPGKAFVTDPQLEWLATGRWKTPEGKLSDVMPLANQQTAQVPVAPPQQPASTDAPQSLNIFLNVGKGENEEERISPQDQLKKFIAENFLAKRDSGFDPMQMAQAITNVKPKNYFA